MKKGFSIISEVIIVGIVITSSVIIVNIAVPFIEEGKELQRFGVSKDILTTIDLVINELASEATGAKRVINVDSLQDTLVFSGREDRIFVRLPLNVELFATGTRTTEGNLIVFSGSPMKTDDNGTDLILENDAMLFSVKKFGNSTNYVWLNTSQLVTMMRNKQLDINASPVSLIMIDEKLNSSFGIGFTELTLSGESLSSSGVRLVMNQTNASIKYEALFTLAGSSDFVEMEIKNVVK